jgi:hypothetical protein
MRLVDADEIKERLQQHFNDCKSAYDKTGGHAWEYMMQAYSKSIHEVNLQSTIDINNKDK